MALFVFELIGCCAIWFAAGYALGLRETKRRLKAHQEVTDRLMGRVPDGTSGGFSGGHDDLLDASAVASTVYPTYGGISRSPTAFTATGIRNQVAMSGGGAMHNPVIYGALSSKLSSIAGLTGAPSPTAEQRREFRKRIYEELKKAME